MIDSHSEVELWNLIVVEAAFTHHALHAITRSSHPKSLAFGSSNNRDAHGLNMLFSQR